MENNVAGSTGNFYVFSGGKVETVAESVRRFDSYLSSPTDTAAIYSLALIKTAEGQGKINLKKEKAAQAIVDAIVRSIQKEGAIAERQKMEEAVWKIVGNAVRLTFAGVAGYKVAKQIKADIATAMQGRVPATQPKTPTSTHEFTNAGASTSGASTSAPANSQKNRVPPRPNQDQTQRSRSDSDQSVVDGQIDFQQRMTANSGIDILNQTGAASAGTLEGVGQVTTAHYEADSANVRASTESLRQLLSLIEKEIQKASQAENEILSASGSGLDLYKALR